MNVVPAENEATSTATLADRESEASDTALDVFSRTVDETLQAVRDRVRRQRQPSATYRVQFNREFTFRHAAELVDYWNDLGISDVYASPYLKAVEGSAHGYDIVDHSALNPEVGTASDFQDFAASLRARGMGHILDFVPNHMGVGSDGNTWWQDVLENGPSSKYASFFDIDWNPLKSDLECKVLLPVLGDQFGRALESGQLTLTFEEGAFFVRYHKRRFPIAPKTYAQILLQRMESLAAKMPADDPQFIEYQSILTAIEHLPDRNETAPAKIEERSREKEVIKRRLQRLCSECPAIAEWIRENVELMNGREGDPASFGLLDDLLLDQAYRLSFWRVAADEINYRRFFDVNELAAVCMERPEVFEATHALIFRLLDEDRLDGLRIDHADGLYDPTNYLRQVQERRFLQLCRKEFERLSGKAAEPSTGGDDDHEAVREIPAWPEIEDVFRKEYALQHEYDPRDPLICPLYLVVEKILERNERIPDNWLVNGTTGYEFLNDVSGVFVDGANARAVDGIYSRFIGRKQEFSQLAYEAKLLIMRASMSSELHVLGHQLDRISERNRWTRDFTLHGLIQSLREVIACFPVYRTYIAGGRVFDRDRRYVEQAVARAKRRNPAVSGEVFDFIRDVLLFAGCEKLPEDERRQRESFVGRFQQFTGPMMAKAVEDTAAYRYNRLASLNEVGGDPERFGLGVAEFHQRNLDRYTKHPLGLLATSTHDTKRSEDVRARVNVLSELPAKWKSRLGNWTRWNKRKKTKLDGELCPSRNDEYLLYQALLGTWPFDPPHGEALAGYVKRIQQYMTKAVREAKVFSSWIAPNEAYEQALHAFIEAILADEPRSAFRTDFEPFARQIAECGMWNSLGQLLLKLTSPGVPDIYQGTEFWDFSLVDPDNRRMVDYAVRRERLAELRPCGRSPQELQLQAAKLVESSPTGAIKMFVLVTVLDLRKRFPALFSTGEYVPLEARGDRHKHVVAFARRTGDTTAVTVVPRLTVRLGHRPGAAPLGADVWGDTRIRLPAIEANQQWRHVFTGETFASTDSDSSLRIADLLGLFPVALLEKIARDS